MFYARGLGSGCFAGGIADHAGSIGYVTVDHGARFDPALCADADAWQDDGSGADEASFADVGVQVKAARHVVRENNGMMIDNALCADMDALRPCAIDQRGCRYPGCRIDVHLPEPRLHKPLPTLYEGLRECGSRGFFGHAPCL